MTNLNAHSLTQFRKRQPRLWLLSCAGSGLVTLAVIFAVMTYRSEAIAEYPLVPDQHMREYAQSIDIDKIAYLRFVDLGLLERKVTERKAVFVFVNALRHADRGQGPETSNRTSAMKIYYKSESSGSQTIGETFLYHSGNTEGCYGREFYEALQKYAANQFTPVYKPRME